MRCNFFSIWSVDVMLCFQMRRRRPLFMQITCRLQPRPRHINLHVIISILFIWLLIQWLFFSVQCKEIVKDQPKTETEMIILSLKKRLIDSQNKFPINYLSINQSINLLSDSAQAAAAADTCRTSAGGRKERTRPQKGEQWTPFSLSLTSVRTHMKTSLIKENTTVCSHLNSSLNHLVGGG